MRILSSLHSLWYLYAHFSTKCEGKMLVIGTVGRYLMSRPGGTVNKLSSHSVTFHYEMLLDVRCGGTIPHFKRHIPHFKRHIPHFKRHIGHYTVLPEPYVARHSPYVARHSPYVAQHSSYVARHSAVRQIITTYGQM